MQIQCASLLQIRSKRKVEISNHDQFSVKKQQLIIIDIGFNDTQASVSLIVSQKE